MAAKSRCALDRTGRTARAFTLLEMMLAMGLAVLTMSILSFTVLRLNATARTSEERFNRKAHLIAHAEEIRWQLRCLYSGGYDSSANNPASHTEPGTIKKDLYGKRTGTEGHDFIFFNTTYLPKRNYNVNKTSSTSSEAAPAKGSVFAAVQQGTYEVGYCILEDTKSRQPYLAYRQFPWVDRMGLHDNIDVNMAPWRPLDYNIVGLKVEYSTNNETWQAEWTEDSAPEFVRITLTPKEGDPFVTQVSPMVVSDRW